MRTLRAMQDVPGMDESECQKFLATSNLPLRLATIDARGDPVIHPVWYLYENGRIYIFTEKDSRKSTNLSRTRNAYFCIDTDSSPYRGIKGKARSNVVRDLPKAHDICQKIISRYMGESDTTYAESMMESVSSGSSIVIELMPLYYSTWDYAKIG